MRAIAFLVPDGASLAVDKLDISIHSITYSPVGIGRTPKVDFWAKCIAGTKLDEIVTHRFNAYLQKCYDGGIQKFDEVTFQTADGEFLKKKLREMQKLDLTPKNEKRRECAQELADALSQKMEASSHGLSGAIFVVQATVNKKQYMTIIKLDFGRTEIIALEQVQSEDLFSKAFERALTGEARDLRKAVMLPSPSGADARSGQIDNFSDYWRVFVGTTPVRPAMNTSRAVMDLVSDVMREDGKQVTAEVAVDFVSRVNKSQDKSSEKVAEILREVTDSPKSTKRIQERLEKELKGEALPGMLNVNRVTYSFGHGLPSWSVPTALIKSGKVKVESKGHTVFITIRDAELNAKPQFDEK